MMVKNIGYSIGLSGAIMGIFYFLDVAPRDNGGNFIFFSFLSICCIYLFFGASIFLAALCIFKNYFNRFLITFALTFLIFNAAAIYLIGAFESFRIYLFSRYTALDLGSGLILIMTIIFYHLRNSIKGSTKGLSKDGADRKNVTQ
jgi:hypothetical protein